MRFLVSAAFVFFVLPSAGVSQPTNNPELMHQEILNELVPDKVSSHTYVIHGPDRAELKANKGFVNNPGFVVTDKSVVVIDPGTSVQIGRAVLSHIRRITSNPVTHVFNTHIHGDHWLGNQAFMEENSNVKIYAHRNMIAEGEAGGHEQWLSIFMNITEGAIKGTMPVLPDSVLTDGESIRIDNISIKAHVVDWAHTKTDAMIEVVEDHVLFTGDIVNNGRVVPFNDGSYKGSIDAISRALRLDIEKVVPGHGLTAGKELLELYKQSLQTIYQTAKNLSEEGLEDYEMKDTILEKTTAFSGWSGLTEEIGRYLNLAVLEAEQEGF